MKRIIYAIEQWWCKVGAEYHRKRVKRLEQDIWNEASQRLQVREFNGNIYLCFDNHPILGEDDMVENMGNAVEEARTNYFDYMYYKHRGMLPDVHR